MIGFIIAASIFGALSVVGKHKLVWLTLAGLMIGMIVLQLIVEDAFVHAYREFLSRGYGQKRA